MKTLTFLLLAVCALFFSCAQTSTESPFFHTAKGAIKGYDPVAYFTDSKPVKGADSISYSWQGAEWHFASTAHKDLFVAAPGKYAPQFGGYCAYGWSDGEGHAAPVDPSAWSIVEGKLYLNYNADVKELWVKDIPGRIEKANKNYAAQKSH